MEYEFQSKKAMSKYVGIWIDRRKAYIVSFYKESVEIDPKIK